MWLFNLPAIVLLVILSACGFKPLYKKETFDLARGKVEVIVSGKHRDNTRELSALIEREFSYKAVEHKAKPFRLEVNIDEYVQDLAISRYSYSTRRKVKVSVSYILIDNKNSKVLDKGAFNSFASFDLSQTSDYSNEVGQEYSTGNNIKILADQLLTRTVAVIEDVSN